MCEYNSLKLKTNDKEKIELFNQDDSSAQDKKITFRRLNSGFITIEKGSNAFCLLKADKSQLIYLAVSYAKTQL